MGSIYGSTDGGLLTQPHPSGSVKVTVVVNSTPDRAFEFFVGEMARWWDPNQHVLKAPLAAMLVERRVGGGIIDRGVDGSETRWGTVLAYEPPHRFVFAWHVSPLWTIEPDPSKASEVEVQFLPEGPGRTEVTLEHKHFERHGEGWETMRDAVASPESWPAGLRRLAELAGGPR
jgi:uncharacterized protein YndB with AHSA1/START domain